MGGEEGGGLTASAKYAHYFFHEHSLQRKSGMNSRTCSGLSLAHLWWLVVVLPVKHHIMLILEPKWEMSMSTI